MLVSAATLEPRGVRPMDAIHLASALRLGCGLSAFVSYDARQLAAAAALGLPTLTPS